MQQCSKAQSIHSCVLFWRKCKHREGVGRRREDYVFNSFFSFKSRVPTPCSGQHEVHTNLTFSHFKIGGQESFFIGVISYLAVSSMALWEHSAFTSLGDTSLPEHSPNTPLCWQGTPTPTVYLGLDQAQSLCCTVQPRCTAARWNCCWFLIFF